jgi:hypothetical protein
LVIERGYRRKKVFWGTNRCKGQITAEIVKFYNLTRDHRKEISFDEQMLMEKGSIEELRMDY